MKSIGILLLLVFISCGKTQMGTVNLMVEFDETVTKNNTEITFLELLEESRCPSDAICGWPGLARVKILLVTNENAHTFEMIKINGPSISDTIIENMTVKLLDVSPYPLSTQAIDSTEYSITLQIQ